MSPPNKSNRAEAQSTRTFVCIEIPAAIRARIEDLQTSLRRQEALISWVRPANVHLTIKFLGNVAATRMPSVVQAVQQACRSIPPFDVTVSGTGCFPAARNPRVLWIGLGELPDQLVRLQANVEQALEGVGFAREAKRFSPHLTVARVRDAGKAKSTIDDFLAAGFAAGQFRASEVIVMRSELNPAGSIYTPLDVVELRMP